ncbi:hypothetical protein ACFLX0_03790 [Chloroflexota bacterium]
MAILAWVFATLGGATAVMGIITAAGVNMTLGDGFTAMFWLALSAVLLLICVAAAVANSSNYE